MVKEYRIQPKAVIGVNWLLNVAGVSPEAIDASLGEKADHVLTTDEAAHFIYQHKNWRRYLPALDQLIAPDGKPYVHPLDTRKIPKAIRDRIIAIKDKIVRNSRWNACSTFAPQFYVQLQVAFDDGAYITVDPSFGDRRAIHTAAESFQAYLNRQVPHQPVEVAYQIRAAFAMIDTYCTAETVATQNHHFVRAEGKTLDPYQLGELGWSKTMSDAEVASDYYYRRAMTARSKTIHDVHLKTALMINPNNADALSQRATDFLFKPKATNERIKAVALRPDDSFLHRQLERLLSDKGYLSTGRVRQIVRKHVEKYPSNPHAIELAATVCSWRGFCQWLGRSLDRSMPKSGHGGYVRAIDAFNNNTPAQARRQTDAALKVNPEHPNALLALATVHLSAGNIVGATDAAAHAGDIAPTLAGAFALLADITLIEGYVLSAMDNARRAYVATNDVANGLSGLIYATRALGKNAEAVELAKDYVQLDSSNFDALFTLADILTKNGNLEAAVKVLKGIEKVFGHKDNPKPLTKGQRAVIAALYTKLYLLYPDADRAKTIDFARHAVSLDASNRLALSTLIQVYTKQGKFTEGIEAAKQAIVRFPRNASFHAQLVALYHLAKKPTEARETMDKALALSTTDLSTRSSDLLLHLAAGDKSKVRHRLEQMSTELGALPEAQAVMSLFTFLLGDVAKAELMANGALIALPYDASALFTLGLIALGKGDNAAAIQFADTLIKIWPLSPDGHHLLAKAALAKGKFKVAEESATFAQQLQLFDITAVPELSVERTLNAIAIAKSRE